jgi:hypothetical protein
MRLRIQNLLQSNLHVKPISASIPRSHGEHRDLLVSVDNLQAERPLRLGSSCPRSLFWHAPAPFAPCRTSWALLLAGAGTLPARVGIRKASNWNKSPLGVQLKLFPSTVDSQFGLNPSGLSNIVVD